MKLALEILRKSLFSMGQHRASLCFSGFTLIALIAVAEVFFPYRGSINDEGNLLLWNGWEVSVVLLIISILLGSAFVVQVHRHVLCPDAVRAGPLGMRFGLTEIRFILYNFVTWAAFFLGFMITSSPTIFGFYSIDVTVNLEKAFGGAPVVELVARVLAIFLVAKLMLCLPATVVQAPSPFRMAWRLSQGRILTLVIVVAIPMIVGDYLVGPLIGLAEGLVQFNWNGTNIFHFILGYSAGFFFTAYAAMLLSHTYLELTRDDAVTEGSSVA